MPDVQALEVRGPRRLLPAAAAGSAPVRTHPPLEPPPDPGERLDHFSERPWCLAAGKSNGPDGSPARQSPTAPAALSPFLCLARVTAFGGEFQQAIYGRDAEESRKTRSNPVVCYRLLDIHLASFMM